MFGDFKGFVLILVFLFLKTYSSIFSALKDLKTGTSWVEMLREGNSG